MRGGTASIVMDEAFAAKIAKELAKVPPHATGALVVRLGAIRRNYRKLRAAASKAGTAAVVKANAYGLGAAQCVPSLEEEGCRSFFVATLSEARALRQLSAGATIYVLDGLLPRTARSSMSFGCALSSAAWRK